MRRALGVSIALAAVLLVLPAASASAAASGTITRALASLDGSSGSFAGSVTWTGCEPHGYPPEKPDKPGPGEEKAKEIPTPRHCGWIPVLTVGTGTTAADCDGRRIAEPETLSGATVVWSEGERFDAGTQSFEVDGVPLGAAEALLACLAVVEVATDYGLRCLIPEWWECPPPEYPIRRFPHTLAAVMIGRSATVPPVALPGQPAKKRKPRHRGRGAKSGRLQVHRNVAVS